MIDYIQRNKEWIFSGAGVAIIGAIWALVRHLIRKKGRKPPKAPSVVTQHAIQETTNPSHGLTVERIVDEINSAPPYQKDAIAKNFTGIYVNWEGRIWDIGSPLFSEPGSTDVVVEAHTGDFPHEMHKMHFTVSLVKYPQFKILKRGDQIGVSGTIKKCSGPGMYVELDVAEITFAK